MLFKATGQYVPLGMRSAHAAEKSIDGFGPKVPGTTIQAIAKAVTTMGIALDTLFPNDTTRDPAIYGDYSFMSKEAIAEALTRATEQSYFFTGKSPSIDTLKQYIEQYDGALLEVQVGPESLRPHSQVVSGHFIYCPAHDGTNIIFPNQWSKDWGDKGWGYFGANYVPHIINGLVFKKIPVSVKQTLQSQPELTPKQLSIAQQVLADIELALGLIKKEAGS
jgi:hypothetical protein